jgi:hypothetical protein
MPKMKNNTMLSSYALTPYRAGEIPMPYHTFEDFAIPRVYALICSAESARVYTPNPWYPDTVHFYDWILYHDGIWRRTQGAALTVNAARDDWKSRIAKGHTPRDVIENPLNGDKGEPWDEFANHFCPQGTYGFHELIRSYKFDYPRKAK